MRTAIIDASANVLRNQTLSNDIKNLALNGMKMSIQTVQEYSKDIIQIIIDMVSTTNLVPSVIDHLLYIQQQLQNEVEISGEESYSYEEFLDDLNEQRTHLEEIGTSDFDEHVRDGGLFLVQILEQNFSARKQN